MTQSERFYSEDLAKARGVTVRQAQRLLEKLRGERGSRVVGRDGRRLYTTAEAIGDLDTPNDGDRLDALQARVEVQARESLAAEDLIDSLRREFAGLRARIEVLERRR